MHKTLKSQLKKASCSAELARTPALKKLLELVDAEYARADAQRCTLESARDVCAHELQQVHEELSGSQQRHVRTEKLLAIGKLASGVGHELRNPLGAIRNALYYIADALKEKGMLESDAALSEMLGIAEREIVSAMRIIGDLLDFTRVQKPLLEPLNLAAAIEETVSRLEVPAGITVSLHIPQNLPRVLADGERLAQVVINLATNAMQALSAGGELAIHAAVLKEDNGREMMAVDFADTGPGIEKSVQARIFEPLFSTKAKGTGLGLPICAEIMNAHGGSIALHRSSERGSTFRLMLPLAPAPRPHS